MVKALVVDDSRAVRMVLARSLSGLGYEVGEAANGREALGLIAAGRYTTSLVLTDWNMPEMNGLESLKQLRQDPKPASLVVVMVTTETQMVQMAEALEAGVNEYIMKPFTQDILAEKLRLTGIHP